jgi:hypothetical protein
MFDAQAPEAPMFDAQAPEAPMFDAQAPEAPMFDTRAPEAPGAEKLPDAPATRDDFVRLARARRAVLERTIEALAADPPIGYDAALAALGEGVIGDALRRWWEMRVTRAPGAGKAWRETWFDISKRHPYWDSNRTAGALVDWLREVHYADGLLLEEIKRGRDSPAR